jgi:hypothetical protein
VGCTGRCCGRPHPPARARLRTGPFGSTR